MLKFDFIHVYAMHDLLVCFFYIFNNILCICYSEALVGTHGEFVPKAEFRGYSQAQVRGIFQANQEQQRQKERHQEQEQEQERMFQTTMTSVNRYLDWHDRQEEREKEQLKQTHLQLLKQQMEEQQARKKQDQQDRFGQVESSFFDGMYIYDVYIFAFPFSCSVYNQFFFNVFS